MIPKDAPCDACDRSHTDDFCNDGFHTEGSAYICARFSLSLEKEKEGYIRRKEHLYEQAVIREIVLKPEEDHEPEDSTEV